MVLSVVQERGVRGEFRLMMGVGDEVSKVVSGAVSEGGGDVWVSPVGVAVWPSCMAEGMGGIE